MWISRQLLITVPSLCSSTLTISHIRQPAVHFSTWSSWALTHWSICNRWDQLNTHNPSVFAALSTHITLGVPNGNRSLLSPSVVGCHGNVSGFTVPSNDGIRPERVTVHIGRFMNALSSSEGYLSGHSV
jgi:hypothetical protein